METLTFDGHSATSSPSAYHLPLGVGLKPLDSATEAAWRYARSVIGDDVGIGSSQGFEAVRARFCDRPMSWFIMWNDTPVGFFSLSPSFVLGLPYVETGTLLGKGYRGLGINEVVKKSTALAVREHGAYHLVAHVLDSNQTSNGAMLKCFPGIRFEPLNFLGGSSGRIYHIHEHQSLDSGEWANSVFASVYSRLYDGMWKEQSV